MHKQCAACKVIKDTVMFSKNRQNPDGFAYFCRICNRQKVNAWRKANPERAKAIYDRFHQKRKQSIA